MIGPAAKTAGEGLMAAPPTSRLQAGPGTRASGLRRRGARSLCGAAAATARHRHPTTSARPGPPTALVSLAAPPPASRPPCPPTLERLRRENTVITTTTAAVSVHAVWRIRDEVLTAPPRLRK